MDLNGIIIVDKPEDWTSHDVVAKLRNALKTKRIGHGGTLDPMATGVLPIFVGRATRASEFCENAEKEYVADIRLGMVTDTQDITGNVLGTRASSVSSAELEAILATFVGPQKQIPPMYSAIKKNGKKLYELARKGIEVERQARDINISTLELMGSNGSDFTLHIVCSKGTYIRTICHDIGAALGVGGTMSSLRRTKAGAFDIEMAHTLEAILASAAQGDISQYLRAVDSIFSEYPAVMLCAAQAAKVKHGAQITVSGQPDGRYRFYGAEDEFLALGNVENENVKMIKNFFGVES
ncbi:MAG: tRNA pseudouridine(55) synthase TruB [Oscillospiraceae bacterium]|nr:tRNA pseudouridine(55) synthase TruB [Oscillospiraceae bacterium]